MAIFVNDQKAISRPKELAMIDSALTADLLTDVDLVTPHKSRLTMMTAS